MSDLSFWLRSPGGADPWWSCWLRSCSWCLQNCSCSRCSRTPLPVAGRAAGRKKQINEVLKVQGVSRYTCQLKVADKQENGCNDGALNRHFVFRPASPSPQNVNRHCACENLVIYTSWCGVSASGYSLTDKNSALCPCARCPRCDRAALPKHPLTNCNNKCSHVSAVAGRSSGCKRSPLYNTTLTLLQPPRCELRPIS